MKNMFLVLIVMILVSCGDGGISDGGAGQSTAPIDNSTNSAININSKYSFRGTYKIKSFIKDNVTYTGDNVKGELIIETQGRSDYVGIKYRVYFVSNDKSYYTYNIDELQTQKEVDDVINSVINGKNGNYIKNGHEIKLDNFELQKISDTPKIKDYFENYNEVKPIARKGTDYIPDTMKVLFNAQSGKPVCYTTGTYEIQQVKEYSLFSSGGYNYNSTRRPMGIISVDADVCFGVASVETTKFCKNIVTYKLYQSYSTLIDINLPYSDNYSDPQNRGCQTEIAYDKLIVKDPAEGNVMSLRIGFTGKYMTDGGGASFSYDYLLEKISDTIIYK